MTCPRIDVDATQSSGSVTIDGHLMHRTAFAIAQVSDLWLNAPLRGGDLIVPGRDGVLSLPRTRDARKVALPVIIDGRYLPDGSEASHERVGLRATLAWFDTNITGPADGDGTRVLVLTDPDDDDDLTSDVTVEDLEVGQKVKGLWLAVLDLTLPAGALAPA